MTHLGSAVNVKGNSKKGHRKMGELVAIRLAAGHGYGAERGVVAYKSTTCHLTLNRKQSKDCMFSTTGFDGLFPRRSMLGSMGRDFCLSLLSNLDVGIHHFACVQVQSTWRG